MEEHQNEIRTPKENLLIFIIIIAYQSLMYV